MNIYLGIDPGLNGGLVAINENEGIEYKCVMPTLMNKKKDLDIKEIGVIIEDLDFYAKEKKGQLFVILEKQYVRPVSGKRSCWMNGFSYGVLRTAIAFVGVQTELVTPQIWMKALGLNSKDKKGSIKYCVDKYPSEDWTATERSRKVHDGLTDAL